MDSEIHLDIAASYARGRLHPSDSIDESTLYKLGKEAGLPMHRFKRTSLPRIHKALGILHGLQPQSLLDIGAGRGSFLWPFLEAFPTTSVTAVDLNPDRVADFKAVQEGGVARLNALCHNAEALPFKDRSFDVVTALEVLEHLKSPWRACSHMARIACRFILTSVPSKPDNNPEHLHYFTPEAFKNLWRGTGVQDIKLVFVRNHMLAVIKCGS